MVLLVLDRQKNVKKFVKLMNPVISLPIVQLLIIVVYFHRKILILLKNLVQFQDQNSVTDLEIL